LGVVAEEDEPGVMGRLAGLLGKNLGPGVLRVVEDERDELHQRFLGFVASGIRPVDRCGNRRSGASTQEGKEVLFEDKAQDEEDHHAAQSDVHASEAESTSASAPIVLVSAIVNIVARPARCPAH
jgi:hypothetical protein